MGAPIRTVMAERIQILSNLLANQIAAGEVVEKPASVVKELIENSLDAGATHIQIDIKQGGHELIRVRDDGKGIMKDDLALALARHATSKITQLADLEAVASLGFRGEALASISAVSRLILTSRHYQSDSAWAIKADQTIEPEPASHLPGTSIEVHDLFYNTPARRKFLRQPKTEFDSIQDVIHKLALSRFDVGLRLTHNQRQVFLVNPAQTKEQIAQRVESILGSAFMEQAIAIEFQAAELQLQGWLALPSFNRSQADLQYCYLNGRYVRDKLLSHAVRQAFEDVLFHGRHPAYVLYLTCPPQQVDVNVHPTKHEVRFRDSRSVHQFMVHAVLEALEQFRPGTKSTSTPVEISPPTASTHDSINPAVIAPPSTSASNITLASSKMEQEPLILHVNEIAPIYPHPKPVSQSSRNDKTSSPPTPVMGLGCVLAQLRNTYILAQNSAGLVIVDIHAAHERITYEKMKKSETEESRVTQTLLTPLLIKLNHQEYNIWEMHQDNFKACGLETEMMGPGQILVREIPVLLQKHDLEQILRDVLSDLAVHGESVRVKENIRELLGNIACRQSIRANYTLAMPEMDALLRQMEQTPNSGFCNHGRPTWKQITWSELDKFFLRGR